MKQYRIRIHGESPLLMHQDNIAWGEKVRKWGKDPANRDKSMAGDDRTPAWTWLGYLYHDGKNVGMPSDNLMTMFREGGAKVPKCGKSTFKKETQAGILIDQQQWDLTMGGRSVDLSTLNALTGVEDFSEHLETVEKLGFELLIKRAKIGASKHIRVRPIFRQWDITGSLTILDPSRTGITRDVLQTILDQAGALCGLGDWRPSSPKSPGVFGRFTAEIE